MPSKGHVSLQMAWEGYFPFYGPCGLDLSPKGHSWDEAFKEHNMFAWSLKGVGSYQGLGQDSFPP